jgi:hypothetical protein
VQKNTSIQMLSIASGIFLFWVREIVKPLPEWVMDALLVLSILFFIIGFGGLFGLWNKVVRLIHKPNKISQKTTILPIQQIQHGKKPSLIISYCWLLYFSLFLFVGLILIYSWSFGYNPFIITPSTFAGIVLYIIAPIYILLDMWVIRRKYYRLTKSSVSKDADFITSGDYNVIRDNCRRILHAMSGNRIDRPTAYFKTNIGKSKVIVHVKRKKNSRVNVYVVSDAHWITVRHDDGSNQKNIDIFTQMLYRSIRDLDKKTI